MELILLHLRMIRCPTLIEIAALVLLDDNCKIILNLKLCNLILLEHYNVFMMKLKRVTTSHFIVL